MPIGNHVPCEELYEYESGISLSEKKISRLGNQTGLLNLLLNQNSIQQLFQCVI